MNYNGYLKLFVGLLCLIIMWFVCLTYCLGSASQVPKYWQDTILKPEQAWIEAYGYNNESILAYNVRSLIRVAQQQEIVIVALKKELDNVDIQEFIPTWPDYISLKEDLQIVKPRIKVEEGSILMDEDGNILDTYEPTTIYPEGTKIYFFDPNEVKE